MSIRYRYFCTGCGTRFNDPWYACMFQTHCPTCPCCGTDYYVMELGE